MAVTTSAILVRALGACGNAIGYVIMLELFPTPIRNLVMSLANGASYGSSMISPFVGGTLVRVNDSELIKYGALNTYTVLLYFLEVKFNEARKSSWR